MNIDTLEKAKQRVPSISVLVNMVSIRVRQLISGQRPLIKPENQYEEKEETAIREISEGKIVAEIDFAKTNDKHD